MKENDKTTMKDHEGMPTEKLNESYQALEKMRKLNLEVTCTERGIPFDAERYADHCTTCTLQSNEAQESRFPFLRKLADDVNKEV